MLPAIFSDIILPVKCCGVCKKVPIVVLIPVINLLGPISSRLIGLGVSSFTTPAFSFSPDCQLNG